MRAGPDQEVQFDGEEITFKLQRDIQDGWEINTLTPPKVRHLSV